MRKKREKTRQCSRCGLHACTGSMWWTSKGPICSPCHEASNAQQPQAGVLQAADDLLTAADRFDAALGEGRR